MSTDTQTQTTQTGNPAGPTEACCCAHGARSVPEEARPPQKSAAEPPAGSAPHAARNGLQRCCERG